LVAVTNFLAFDINGYPVLADAHGNNVAFRCLGCGAPVLAVMLEHQRGSSSEKPSACRACRSKFWVEVLPDLARLVVHRLAHHDSA
jgi:uncharacterized protein with PIN domain